MCGIFLYCGKSRDVQELQECFMRSQHRGPDNTQFIVFYVDEIMIAFGFHRLSINGLNPKANQPLFVDHTLTLCNGEIWNSEQMHRSCGTENTTGSDCECVPVLYQHLNESTTTHKHEDPFETLCNTIDGVFGLVLFDRIQNKICIARDRIGIRSLYYAVEKDLESATESIFVASELKSIPTTVANARAFLPGHWGCFSLQPNLPQYMRFVIEPYWTLRASRRIAYLQPDCLPEHLSQQPDYIDCCERLHVVLTNAVAKRFMSDRSIGCVLSGGLDSTVITAIACMLHATRNPTAPPLRTYTIGMAGGEDLKWARIAAAHFGTEHHEFVITEQEFFDAIPEVIAQVESYDVTTVRASTGNWLLAKHIAKLGKDTVLFCGDVADELLGGYRGFGLTTDADAFDDETVKMVEHIHRFDVLRCEKSFAGHGLEGRVPFADYDVVDLLMSVPPEFKMWDGTHRIEKDLLRRAFQDYLPYALTWRRKEAFSDGVSKKERGWSDIIQEHLGSRRSGATPQWTQPDTRAHASPYDAESCYYRELYEGLYSSVEAIPYLWKQPFCSVADPSARCLQNYNTTNTTNTTNPTTNPTTN
jgi:asparagine synthase (glutamine-hydrolysing)